MAYVVYHTLDKAEFILRKPVPNNAGSNPPVIHTDYSTVQILAARNEILASKA
jgi:hypothetical protein